MVGMMIPGRENWRRHRSPRPVGRQRTVGAALGARERMTGGMALVTQGGKWTAAGEVDNVPETGVAQAEAPPGRHFL